VLATGESGLLSPDGRLIAATPWGFAGPGVTLLTPTGAIKRRFFNAAQMTVTPTAWSPDSRYLAVRLTGPGSNQGELVVINTVTDRVSVVAHGGIAGASFAPDGSDRLVFARSVSIQFKSPTNLFIASASGSSVVPLTHDFWSAEPMWGVRGIAYNHAGGPRSATAINQLWLIQPDGRHATQLTDFTSRRFAFGLTPLQFSADGSRLIAGYQNGPRIDQTWALDVVTHRAWQLRVAGRPVTAWGLSQDGKLALVEQETDALNAAIETIPVGGGRATILAHGDSPSWNR